MAKAPQDHQRKLHRTAPVPVDQRSLVEIVSDPDQEAPEDIPLFSIDGQVYTVPAKVPAGVTLQVMEDAKEHGLEVAVMSAVREVIGDAGWKVLKTHPAVTGEHLEKIMDAVTDLVMGSLEATAGN